MMLHLLDPTLSDRRRIVLLAVILSFLAAAPRFYGLGSLSFYGDEETTAFPARSMAQGGNAAMPSGMLYHRALPQTWLNALSAQVVGLDRELSYRVPAAFFGTLTIPIFFLMARPLVGAAAALLAALLLAFSDWHIATSREARMYAPFLFFYLAAALSLWRWSTLGKRRDLFWAGVLSIFAISLHTLGIFLALAAAIPIAYGGWSRQSPWRLLAAAGALAATAHLYSKYVVASAFDSFKDAQRLAPPASNVSHDNSILATLWHWSAELPALTTLGALAGAGLGIWAARRLHTADENPGALIRVSGQSLLAVSASVLACTGHLYGAAVLMLLFLLLHPLGAPTVFEKIKLPAALVSCVAAIHTVVSLGEAGFGAGLKALLFFPFPYLGYFAQMSPGAFILFVGGCIYLTLQQPSPRDHAIRACALAALIILLAIGAVSQWGGTRYLIGAYPFFLLVSAFGLIRLLENVQRWLPLGRFAMTSLAALTTLSGVLAGHGIPQALAAARLSHGDPMPGLAVGFPRYPDHQAAGEYVRRRLEPKDSVVAEDALQQYWYVGRVEYWLRDPISHQRYLFEDEDARLRDVYVASAIATSDILDRLHRARDIRVWVITSAETAHRRDYYLDDAQRRWLSELKVSHQPVFVARDGITRVYCLHCSPTP